MIRCEEVKSLDELPVKYKRIIIIKKITNKIAREAPYFKKGVLRKIGQKINKNEERLFYLVGMLC